jgi:hypothetical protein
MLAAAWLAELVPVDAMLYLFKLRETLMSTERRWSV